MIKRFRWMLMGAGAGVALYLWLSRRARSALPRAREESIDQWRERGREVGARVREAVREGRLVASERAGELRRELLSKE